MNAVTLTLVYIQIFVIISCQKDKEEKKKNVIYKEKRTYRYPNPGLLQDRSKLGKTKPLYPDLAIMNRPRSFNPAVMDYCDPYHCNDYHKIACGLNRERMKFQWFQSGCHIVLNNKCATYRGFLKFDQVDTKYCRAYVMNALRGGCPEECSAVERPVCAVRLDDNQPAVFRNRCQLYATNCRSTLQLYVEVSAEVCLGDADLVVDALEAITDLELKTSGADGGAGTAEHRYYIE